jgi:PAS domain S-box-containing protein
MCKAMRDEQKTKEQLIEELAEMRQSLSKMEEKLASQQQAEVQVQQKQHFLHTVVETTPDIIYVYDLVEQRNVYINHQIEEILGYSCQEIQTIREKVLPSLIHPDDIARVKEHFELFRTCRDSEAIEIEYRMRHANGEWRWLYSRETVFARNAEGLASQILGVAQDITERRNAITRLHESEQRFRHLADTAPVMIWMSDTNKLCNHFNQPWLDFTGRTLEQEIGNGWTEAVHPHDRKDCINKYQNAFDARQQFTIEYRLKRFDGEYRWILDTGIPRFDSVGNFVGYIGSGIDITEQKQILKALGESEERFRCALMDAPLPILLRTEDGEVLLVNRTWTELTGYSIQEIPTLKDWLERAYGKRQQQVTDEIERVLPIEGPTAMGEYAITTAMGTTRIWDIYASLLGPFAHRRLVVVMAIDVTQRKQIEADLQQAKAQLEMKVAERTVELLQANNHLHRLINILTATINQQTKIEAQLREAERRWRSLLENVRLLVIGLDSEGKVEYVNPFFLELGGYTREEVLGKYWFTTFIPQYQQQDMQKILRESLQGELHTHHENQVLTKFGKERTIVWNNTLLRDAKSQIVGMMSIGEDITQRQALEKIKDEFISVVSHELRTPMTSIHAGLNLLATGLVKLDSEKGRRLIEIAAESTERLVRLVNDMLDLERLQSGKITLNKQKIKTDELLRESTELMQVIANQSEVNISVFSQSIELTVDKDRIIQVLTNILSNAIKFSSKGSTILFTVEKIQAKDGRSCAVLFKSQDQGRGIPAEQIETIFERFHQVDASDSRKQGGTGLGLAIARNIVQQHNGQIWVESQVGLGSTFYVMLPISENSEQ